MRKLTHALALLLALAMFAADAGMLAVDSGGRGSVEAPPPSDEFPSWYPAAGVSVEIDSGTTIAGAATADGCASFPGSDDCNVTAPWGDGAIVYISSQPYLVVMGGGHSDGAYNGILKFGPLFGAGADTPTWSVFLAASSVGSVSANSGTYSDGRQAAVHSYNYFVGVGSTLYSMATDASYGGSAVDTDDVYAFTPAGQTALADNTVRTSKYGAAGHYGGRIFYISANANFDRLRIYNIAGNSWSSESAGDIAFSNYVAMAIDSTRGAALVSNGSDTVYWSDLAGTPDRATGKNDPSGYDQALDYDPDRDAFVSYVSGSLTIRELDASSLASGGNPSWTDRPFTGDDPPSSDAAGTFGRFAYVPELHGFVVAPSSSSSVYFFRSE